MITYSCNNCNLIPGICSHVAPSIQMAAKLSTKLLLLSCLHVAVALVFLKGFLLTRVELPDIAKCPPGAACSHQPTFSKAVVMIVDALRYDFLCDGVSSGRSFQGRLPKTLGLVGAARGAAVASRFVADTPTITMSRLKALLTGGLPTFLDVGQSFSASALSEDNLLHQLLAQGKKLVVMGDDTWMQLAKDAFSEAYPYPSFDVHDLHSVDDGVWEHLLPLLQQPQSWDLLIAHYLGVDHAGHTYGVNSRQMEAKLAQMDEQVSHVIETLAAQAGPGGPHADTLLLVLSDHGQTLGGDHGGGTPDETDSVLIAISLRQMHKTLQQQRQLQDKQEHIGRQPQSAVSRGTAAAAAAEAAAPAEAVVGGGGTPAQQPGQQQEQVATGGAAVSALLDRLVHAGGYTDKDYSAAGQAACIAPADPVSNCSSSRQHCWPWLCSTSMSQIDLTPLLAHLLGVAIPFGNLGKVPPHLFMALTAADHAHGPERGPDDWLLQYTAALHANAGQVHAYLNRYAAVGGLPAPDLATVNGMYQQVQQLRSSTAAEAPSLNSEAEEQTATAASTEQLAVAQLAYLTAAVKLARRRFTLFQQGPIWAGCVLGVAVLVLQLVYCWRAVARLSPASGAAATNIASVLLFTGLAAFHALGLFSVGLLMGEGRLQCVLLMAVTLLMLRAALEAVLRARSLTQKPAEEQGSSCGAASDAGAEATTVDATATAIREPLVNGVAGTSTGCTSAEQATAGSGCMQSQQAGEVVSSAKGPAGNPDRWWWWCSWQPAAVAVGAAATMLLCNALLQALGLIDRAGQDPHDKTQPSFDLLVGPGAAWQRALYISFTVGPVVCMWAALSRLGAFLRHTILQGSVQGSVASETQHSCIGVLVWVTKALCFVQHVSIAAFWVTQLSGNNDHTLSAAAKLLWGHVQHFICGADSDGGCAVSLAGLLDVVNAGGVRELWQAVLQSTPAVAVLQLSLRLLLPRIVYVSALAAFCGVGAVGAITVAMQCLKNIVFRKGCFPNSEKAVQLQVTGTGCELCMWLCSVLAAALVVVLGYKGPATMLLAMLQAGCICVLLRLCAAATEYTQLAAPIQHSQLHGQVGNKENSSAVCKMNADNNRDITLASCACADDNAEQCDGVLQGAVGSGAWGMMSLQLFFCSSHFCEFSGLQYASAFIGFDAMVWYTSGSLLLLNTCGFLLLGCLSLPVMLAVCMVRYTGSAGRSAVLQMRQQLECGTCVMNSMRFAALVVSMVSAAVQQQHILLWAIFAPKLVFELWFMAVVDVGQIFASALVEWLL